MINIRNLRIDPASLGDKMLLVDIAPAYAYKDGVKTDNVTGYKYTVALTAHQLDKLVVRIEGNQRLDLPIGYAEVEFVGLEVGLYEIQGKVQLTARAADITLAKGRSSKVATGGGNQGDSP